MAWVLALVLLALPAAHLREAMLTFIFLMLLHSSPSRQDTFDKDVVSPRRDEPC